MNVISWEIVVGIVVQLVIFAVAWGDVRRQVTFNREQQDERHSENQHTMHEIRDDVRKTNGMVIRHTALIEQHTDELKHLRRFGKD